MGFQIAIDGPAGAGKSTVARGIAGRFDFLYVDTGALYRAMACYFLKGGIRADDEEAVRSACDAVSVTMQNEGGAQRVFVNGADVTEKIRREEVGNAASAVGACPSVRKKLLGLQREIAEQNDVVMDGRDIGTCVLPAAQLKVFLTADAHTRALRRYRELLARGIVCTLSEVERDIEERDKRDSTRAVAPLRQAKDAKVVDTSAMDAGQVIRTVSELAKAVGAKAGGVVYAS